MTALRHIHLRSWPWTSPPRFPTYALANAMQTELQQRLLRWKAATASAATSSTNTPNHADVPPPTLLTFTPAPTYTLGRRQTTPLSSSELARLQRPLSLRYDVGPGQSLPPADNDDGNSNGNDSIGFALAPEVTHAPRGGLTTYHGPGQVVFWPVLDLRSPLHRHLGVRDYACLLERTTIAALARFGVRGFTTDNPGVWVRRYGEDAGVIAIGEEEGEGETKKGTERKIAALGVHLRRHVTGLGVAVNLGMPVSGSGDEVTNPWARIVACGLGDKGVTSLAAELGGGLPSQDDDTTTSSSPGLLEVTTYYGAAVAETWAREFAARLGLDGGVERFEAGGAPSLDLGLRSLDGTDGYVTAQPVQRQEAVA
ncbi:hypothetical protein DL770_003227 [Monosporascus sp. CRB-9-2]|nr:hypothetical protein DL770_003227 [Monosporascus sp. CRB-9-2]